VVRRWMQEWRRATPQLFEEVALACGIHTGKILFSVVETEFGKDLMAVGPDVNFAALLAGRARQDQILLSQSTVERLEAKFPISFQGEITNIKNLPGSFNLYSAMEAASSPPAS